jgi:hypothetical protein
MRIPVAIFLALISGVAVAQTPENDLLDPLGLARLKNYSASRSTSGHRYVFSNEDSKRILPGETLVIADLEGPGMVSHIWFTGSAAEFGSPRLMRLRVYYDGKKTPSVDSPMGDFFGVGNGYQTDLNSAMIHNTSMGRSRNSYWPMPFRKSCKITMTNEGNRLKSLYYHVDWRKYKSLAEDVGYFHAYYRQEHPAVPGRHYAFLNIRGRGHYVGTVLSILQSQVSWFGEGDDLFYVDGAKVPQIYGTGSEDYFNEAWGLRESGSLWTGSPTAEGERVGSRLSGYRWHVPDPIPFTDSLWAGIEHYGWTYNPDGTPRTAFEERDDYFSSVAFWYQDGVNEGLLEPPYGEARLPLGNAQQIPISESINDVTTEKGRAFVQRGVEWQKDLLTLEAQGIGSRINIPIDIGETGRYELIAQIAQAPNYGNYIALVDNQPTNLDTRKPASTEIPFPGPLVYHNYQPEVYVAVQRPLGWFHFQKGRHTISLVCVGKDGDAVGYDVGVFDVVLERVPETLGQPQGEVERQLTPPIAEPAPPAPAGAPVYRGHTLSAYLEQLKAAPKADRPDMVRALGSFGTDATAAVPQLGEVLNDPDPQMQLAAAWAFSQIGASGKAGVPALGKALSDSNPRVRILAAVALKSMGPAASPALPDLMRALKDSSEYVRSACASALGMMGPAALDAIGPLVERVTKDESGLVVSDAVVALGNMGPAAKEALPAVQQAFKDRRVGAPGEEAILKIQGKPVPTWH